MSEQDLDQNDNPDLNENLDDPEGSENQDLDNPDSPEGDDNHDNQDDQFEVFIGDQPIEQPQDDDLNGKPAPQWVKDLRRKSKESDRRIKELESQLAQNQKPQDIELGEKPTLEDAGYDTDAYDEKLSEWYEQKRKYDSQQSEKQAEQERIQKVWQAKVDNYEVKKAEIKSKVRDFDDVEEVTKNTLSQTQQGIVIHGAENPELIIYALGKDPKKAKELAEIQDPIQFAFAVAKIDTQVKVQTRKPKTQPESKPSGSASISGSIDSKLDALEKEADRTGDRSKVIAYKKSLKK